MTEQEVKELLIKTNAIMEGHFLLTSGLHSPMYVEKFNVLQQPKYTEQLCKALAEYFADKNIDTVVGPMTGGILLAHEVGKALGTRAIFTERVDGKMTFRRGFSLKPGERVAIVEDIVKSKKADYDFVAEDGFGHHFWAINCPETNKRLEELFATKVPYTYVADGHHRTAAAARIGAEFKSKNPNHDGTEEYNFFMAVHFPDHQLKIIDYNRVVKDLNGLTEEQLLAKLGEHFTVEDMGTEIYHPAKLHEFSMYLGGRWYKLTAKPGSYDDNDPIGVLDVTILSNHVLADILDIQDLRTSKRIDFVGGIRGLGELKRRVDNGEMKVAFALYPVSMEQLINIADTGNIMPPKTTWFEPKLRSGMVIHKI